MRVSVMQRQADGQLRSQKCHPQAQRPGAMGALEGKEPHHSHFKRIWVAGRGTGWQLIISARPAKLKAVGLSQMPRIFGFPTKCTLIHAAAPSKTSIITVSLTACTALPSEWCHSLRSGYTTQKLRGGRNSSEEVIFSLAHTSLSYLMIPSSSPKHFLCTGISMN